MSDAAGEHSADPAEWTESGRIVVVSLDNLGDTVWAGALIRALRSAWPASRLGLWCKAYSRPLAGMIPGLDGVHAADPFWEPSPGCPAGSLRRFLAVVRQVRASRYDVAIIVNTRWKVAAAVRAAGVPERVGFAQRRSARWLTVTVRSEDRRRPVLGEWARLLEPLGIDAVLEPRLRVPPGMEGRADALRRSLPPGPVAVLHPFAGDPRRCARPGFWSGLAASLVELGIRGLLIAGAPHELAWLRRQGPGLPPETIWADRVASGLGETLLLLSRADLFVGHDSGPLHCAAALGVPAVGLFLPGDWPRAAARGAGPVTIIRRDTPENLDPRDVVAAAAELMGRGIR